MSKRLLSAALVAGLGLAFVPGVSSAGTITIQGKIMSQSCTVKVNGGAADNTVTLPAIAADVFTGDGDTAGDTEFTIGLSNCDTQFATLNAAAVFDANGNVDPDTHNLLLTDTGTGAAKGIQIQLTDGSGNSINLSAKDAEGQNSPSIDVASGSGTLNYKARYYSKGAVEPGTVNTTVSYTIAYL